MNDGTITSFKYLILLQSALLNQQLMKKKCISESEEIDCISTFPLTVQTEMGDCLDFTLITLLRLSKYKIEFKNEKKKIFLTFSNSIKELRQKTFFIQHKGPPFNRQLSCPRKCEFKMEMKYSNSHKRNERGEGEKNVDYLVIIF